MKSTLVLYRKGLCGFFPVLGFALEEKLRGAKCCKYYGPEGVSFAPDPGGTKDRPQMNGIPEKIRTKGILKFLKIRFRPKFHPNFELIVQSTDMWQI